MMVGNMNRDKGSKGTDEKDGSVSVKEVTFMKEIMEYRERYERPDYDTYFMNMAFLVATRSTCRRRSVGAVIVKDQRILSSGYNGAPRGVRDCLELGTCLRERENIPSGQRHELCRGVHAEQNAIANAAYFGVSIGGSSIYMTESPCNICTKILINAGIKKIIYARRYIDELSAELLGESNIEIRRFALNPTIEAFSNGEREKTAE